MNKVSYSFLAWSVMNLGLSSRQFMRLIQTAKQSVVSIGGGIDGKESE